MSGRRGVDANGAGEPAPPSAETKAAIGSSATLELDTTLDDDRPKPLQGHVDVSPGTRIGQFELIRELGRGGMGQVFLARDTRLARLVALKFLGHAANGLTERFLVEARATARCQHENIVVIYEAAEWNGKPYLALEYIEGESLARLLEDGGVAPARALELVTQVVRALVRAHLHGIVHCDLKPDNILVDRHGVVKVVDFGIARALGQLPISAQNGDEAISGTLPFMAPEQFGADKVDHRTDLWAVGIILWEMLTGRHPLAPAKPERFWQSALALDEPMPRIASVMPECPPALEQLIDRCLMKRKHERIASAAELLDGLEQLLPGRSARRLAGESPYPGMLPFQEGDAGRFFGRGRDLNQMLARLDELPLVGVVAPSGVGKSSFVRAGVIPALKDSGEPWEVFVTRPGRSPLASLAALLQPIAPDAAAELPARLRAEPGYLGTLLRARAGLKRERILLFVDQFEELYTLGADADERRAYTAVLAGIADDGSAPLRVVVSMRSDFLDRAAEDRVFIDRLTRGLVFLPEMGMEGMREALLGPLAMTGFQFEEPELAEEMLAALAGAHGALPLLQFTAAKLWDGRDRERRCLTRARYQAMGGVAGALAAHADDVLAAMTPERQRLARALFLRLVTSDGTRALLDEAEVLGLSADAAEVRALINQLVGARLLVVQSREDGRAVEIVHESLLTRWPTLRRWLDESAEDAAVLEQLRIAARLWDARGRAAGLLWTGEAMLDAQTFARRYKGELAARERAYLDAVIALASRSARRRRRLVVAAFVVLATLFAGAMVAMLSIRAAERAAQEQRSLAEREAARARAAENEVTTQMHTIQSQLDTIQQQQAARSRAEEERRTAEVSLSAAQSEVAVKREDLARANARLESALIEAKAEARRAEEATLAANKSAEALQAALDREKARVKQLEEEKKKLATQLP